MIDILLIASENSRFTGMVKALEAHDQAELHRTGSFDDAKRLMSGLCFRLAIIGEYVDGRNGFDLVKQLLCIDPAVNFAVISELSPDAFEEAGEGLGLIAQLPVNPDQEDISELMKKLQKILDLQGVNIE